MRELGQRRVHARRRITEGESRAACHDVIVRRPGDRRAAGPFRHRNGDRRVEVGLRGQRTGRPVPSAPDHRVAARHQERIGQHRRIDDGARIVGAARAARDTAERVPGLAAAIGRLVHHLVRALLQVDRLEDVEVERVLDLAARISRREGDVDDDGVLGIEGIDLAEGLAVELFILSDPRPRIAAECRRLFRDQDLGDARLRIVHAQRHPGNGERKRQRREVECATPGPDRDERLRRCKKLHHECLLRVGRSNGRPRAICLAGMPNPGRLRLSRWHSTERASRVLDEPQWSH